MGKLLKEAKVNMNNNSNRRKVITTNTKNSKLIRLTVFRSNCQIYAMLIDDTRGIVLTSVSSNSISKKLCPVDKASETGKLIASKAKDLKINKVIFDRNSYKYHGRVKALADGARNAGLKF